MAIDLEWQDEQGKKLARYEGPPIDQKVWSIFPKSGACLRFIDPIGDTVFNHAQIEVLAVELDALLMEATAHPTLAAMRNFIVGARGQVHTYLKFIGD
jgi:hypothetical protein